MDIIVSSQIQLFSNNVIKSIIILFPLFYLGIGNKYPWVLLGDSGRSIGIIVFFIATLCFFTHSLSKKTTTISRERLSKIFKINPMCGSIYRTI